MCGAVGERMRHAETQSEQTSLTGNGMLDIDGEISPAIREEVRAALTRLKANIK